MDDFNARIVIENKQKSEDGDEVFREEYNCRYKVMGKKAYVLYENEGVSTKIKLEPDCVVVTRMGEFSNEMIYKKGEKNTFLYRMPYGSMDMELYAENVVTEFSEKGADVFLEYELLFSGTKNKNNMSIRIESVSL